MSKARLILRLGAKQAWNPLDLGPNVLRAWWNPDLHGNTTYMTDDGGGLISSFSSLNSKLAVTAATTARPTWSASAWTPNSKAGLTYDGTGTGLATTTLTTLPTGSTAGEIWALLSITAGGNVYAVRYGAANAANSRYLFRNGSTQALVGDGTTNLTNTTANFTTGAHILGGYWSGTTEGGRLDGVDFVPATATIGSLNTSTTRLRIGANNGTSGASFWNGVIRHLIITTTLTSAQRLQMEGFFAWDGWSSAAANPLPTSHLYKYAAPVLEG